MKILMLDNEFPPLGGGMGTVNLALLKEFQKNRGLEIDLVTSALGSRKEFEHFSDGIIIHKVPVWNRNIHHSSNRELSLYAIQALVMAASLVKKNSYQMCLAWSALPAGAVAWLLKKIYRLPYLLWVSGPDIPGFEQRYARLYPWLLPLLRQVWQNATPMIVKCQEEADMIHVFAPDLALEIIPNGADLAGFIPVMLTDTPGSLNVICVARLIERKGQHHLLQAVKPLNDEGLDVHLELVGTGDSLSAYQRLARSLGIERKVQFSGYIPREEIAAHYSRADVFVLPSYNEGMSLAALEAMAAGLPLVLTRTGGTQDLVEEGVNGFVIKWGDIDALASALRKLAKDQELKRRMGMKSRQRAEQFSWPMIAARFWELITKATSPITKVTADNL
jgi:phosphatidylinositol alpha-1,6-mannosyltransferase